MTLLRTLRVIYKKLKSFILLFFRRILFSLFHLFLSSSRSLPENFRRGEIRTTSLTKGNLSAPRKKESREFLLHALYASKCATETTLPLLLRGKTINAVSLSHSAQGEMHSRDVNLFLFINSVILEQTQG